MRGCGPSIVLSPSPDLLRKSTSPRRGEVNRTCGLTESIKSHHALPLALVARQDALHRARPALELALARERRKRAGPLYHRDSGILVIRLPLGRAYTLEAIGLTIVGRKLQSLRERDSVSDGRSPKAS